MKGADIVLCRFVNGVAECRDSYALDVGIPTLDTDLGGTNDVFDVKGRIEGDFVIFSFQRRLTTSDSWDKIIHPGDIRIIYAYHPYTNQLVYHGPTRSSSEVITFIPALIIRDLPLVLKILAIVVASIGAIWSIFISVIIQVYPAYFRYRDPLFCQLILLGSLVCYASVFVLIPEPNTVLCTINVWFIGLGYILIFGCLFVSMWRLWRIVGYKKLKVRAIKRVVLFRALALFFLIEIIYLSLWTALDIQRSGFPSSTKNLIYVCKSKNDNIWWSVFVAYKALFLGIGIFLSIKTRNFAVQFNDSKRVSLTIYIMMLALIVIAPLSFALSNYAEVTFTFRTVGMALPIFVVMGLLFGGDIFRIFVSKKPPLSTKSLRGSTQMTKGETESEANS
eukprot:TRINITY_DN4418_c0_g3_i2.p1 TRINITY_DN4418_c0_g3~~TRINITY_DN4418_c0_g3_i2.p1  ORF type:complete len:409 (+),score=36.95 TRINITY_DN4418_c0_g3_i2:52-1227(+)